MWAAARSFIKQAALKVGRENKKKKKKKREEEAFERLVTRFWPISQNQEAADSLICCCRWESAHCLARERERDFSQNPACIQQSAQDLERENNN